MDVSEVTVSLHFIHLLMVSLYFQCIYLQCVRIFHSLQKENPAIIWSREQFDSGDTNDDEIVTLRELYVNLCKTIWEPIVDADFYKKIQKTFDC